MSNESDVERGTVGATGGEGLLESRWSQALARRRCDNFHYLDRLTFGASTTQCKLAKKGVRRRCADRLFDY